MIYLITLLLLLYFISRAYTEAHKWGNPLSSSVYHIWRFIESLFVFVVMVRLYGWNGVGYFLIFLFCYERILMKLTQDKWFKDSGEIFDIGVKIKRYPAQDWFILGTGIGILIIL